MGSAATPPEYPRWDLPEIAIVGRSNAGKSSLLNILGGRHDLARVSKTPGRTQRVHFFAERRHGLAVVDLPGYGFARASKAERELLRGLVLLLDVRRTPEEDERVLVDLARSRRLGVVRVATKVDKLGRTERVRRLRELDRAGLGPWLPFSASTREGREAIVAAITELIAAS